MRQVFDSIFSNFSIAFPEIYFYSDNTIDMTASILCESITEVSRGTDVTYGDYIQYRISDGSGIKFLTKGLDLKKMLVVLNGFNDTRVIEHTVDLLEGDLIKVINVMDIISSGTDPVTYCNIEYKDVVFGNWEYINLPYPSQFHSITQGLTVQIQIKTRKDNNNLRIDEYCLEFLKHIYKNRKIFPIYDSNDKVLGYYTVLLNPTIRTLISEKDNIQNKQITLIGYYNINLKY